MHLAANGGHQLEISKNRLAWFWPFSCVQPFWLSKSPAMPAQLHLAIAENPSHQGGVRLTSPLTSIRALNWIGWGARLVLAGLLLWAGIRKAFKPELFLQDIESYESLPYRWAWLTSIWLPFLEITAAAALLTTRRWAQAGAALIGGMLLVFLAAILSAWARGLSLSCGCFGASTEPANFPWLVARDLMMLGMVAVILLATKDPRMREVPAKRAQLHTQHFN